MRVIKYMLIYFIVFLLVSCNNFKSIKIGDQEWMSENLSVTEYNNGESIFQSKTNDDLKESANQQRGTWCYINDNGDVTIEKTKYGKLYNWYAVNDSRGLAPKDWHIPSIKEWEILYKHLGGDKGVLKVIKNKSGWEDNNTNESQFSSYPTNSNGYATYWSKTGNSTGACFMIYESYIHFGDRNKGMPMAIRCLKGY